MAKYDDFDLNLQVEGNETGIQPMVGSRYACTPGTCWKWICFTTTY